MDSNRPVASQRQTKSHSRARRRLNDEQLELLAQAFGSHLIRNAPPHVSNQGSLINRSVKITAE